MSKVNNEGERGGSRTRRTSGGEEVSDGSDGGKESVSDGFERFQDGMIRGEDVEGSEYKVKKKKR